MKALIRFFLGLTLSLSAAQAAPIASGKIVLPAKLQDAAKGIRTLFVSVYDGSQKGGPMMPYGAIKIELPKDAKAGDVTAFTLDSETMMLMGAADKIPAKLDIKAKLDKDGSAGPDEAGDLVGWTHAVKPGAKNVVVKIDKRVP
jgi:hypothetical protein